MSSMNSSLPPVDGHFLALSQFVFPFIALLQESGEWRAGERAKYSSREKFEAQLWRWFQDHCFWIELTEVGSHRTIILVFFIFFAWMASIFSTCFLQLYTCPPTVHFPDWSFWSESDHVIPPLKYHRLWDRSCWMFSMLLISHPSSRDSLIQPYWAIFGTLIGWSLVKLCSAQVVLSSWKVFFF